MTKLDRIREELYANNDIVVVSGEEKVSLPSSFSWCHTVDYYVAPKKGIYTADGLQKFMMGLLPDIKPTSVDDFLKSDCQLSFGKLYFDEKIGEERTISTRVCTLTDELMKDKFGFVEGQQTIEKDTTLPYMRRVWVRPFPSERIAEDIRSGKLDSEFWIPLDVLAIYRPFLGIVR